MDIRDFRIEPSDLAWTGRDLARPESVIAEPDGTLWCSDGRGGATRIAPDGSQARFTPWGGEPNGLALAPDGRIVAANIALGRVQDMARDGSDARTLLDAIEGRPLGCANHVGFDGGRRLWITSTTRAEQWWATVGDRRADGFVARVERPDRLGAGEGAAAGGRILADGIWAANEARLDADERHLYVAETMAARILRFPVREDGSLGEREVHGPDPLGPACYPDGIVFDAEENLWVALPARNGVGVLTPEGEWRVVLEDPCQDALDAFHRRWEDGEATPEDFLAVAGETLRFVSSVCFAGPDRRRVHLGSLAMDRLPTFRSPIPGRAL